MQNFTCKTDIISGYGNKVLIGLLLTFLFSINTFSQTNLTEESSDIIIYGDVRVYIDTSEQVVTHGSLTGIDGATLENQGTFVFDVNGDYQSIYNFSSNNFFTGFGNYLFDGDADFYVGGDFENALHNLWLNKTDGSNLYLENNLNITNKLYLNTGLVNTSDDFSLIITNKDSAAIVLSEFSSPSNGSYISGNLRRYIATDTGYIFPVGVDNNYYPLAMANTLEGVNYIDVTFRDIMQVDAPLTGMVDFQLGLYNFYALNQTGSWRVLSDVRPTSGSMDLSAYIFNFQEKRQNKLETNMFGLVYNQQPRGADDEWTLSGEYERARHSSRLSTSDLTLLQNTNKFGYYTLAVADITQLINFISPGDGRETRFIIPGVIADDKWEKRYDESELVVFNAMGRKIFEAKPYKNDLDMKEFKDGTYYYIFKYTRNNKPGVIQSFIDVKRVY